MRRPGSAGGNGGDKILLPVSLVNGTASDVSGVNLKVNLEGDSKLNPFEKSGPQIKAKGRVRWLQPIDVGTSNGSHL